MPQQYPRDRFDLIPEDLQRVGAHRAASKRFRGWPWIISCAVAVVVIVGSGWIYLRTLDNQVRTSSNQTAPTSAPHVTVTAKPSSRATPSSAPTATPTPTATVVPSTPVAVLNGAGRAGLAARAKAKLATAGWTAVTTGNAAQVGVAPSVVYYSDPALQGVAMGVAQSLGITTVTQASLPANAGSAQVAVVLGTDYQG
jgi:hypothetical protein